MNQPPDQNQESSAESELIGPAVPPRTDAADDHDDLSEPLAPFFGGSAQVDDEGDVGDDIPWLVDRETAGREPESPAAPLEEPAYLGGVPEVDIDEVPGLVSFDDLEPEPEPQPVAPPPAAPQAGAAASDVDDWESALAARPQAEPSPVSGAPAPPAPPAASPSPGGTRDLHVEQAGGFREAGTAVAHDVADRLERIAHSLRLRGPNELLSGAGDPLEILIVGYVLGASQGQGGTGEDGSPTL